MIVQHILHVVFFGGPLETFKVRVVLLIFLCESLQRLLLWSLLIEFNYLTFALLLLLLVSIFQRRHDLLFGLLCSFIVHLVYELLIHDIFRILLVVLLGRELCHVLSRVVAAASQRLELRLLVCFDEEQHDLRPLRLQEAALGDDEDEKEDSDQCEDCVW